MTAMLSLFISLFAPGAGHVFVGKYGEGILLGALFALGKSALMPLTIRIFKVQDLRRLLYVFYWFNWGYIALVLYAGISACAYGSKAQKMHFLHAILFVFCVILIYKRTFNKFIFTALCGRTGVYECWCKLRKTPSGEK